MSKNLAQISSYVQRKGRIDNSNAIDLAAITEDANDAIGIIASLRNWDELYKTDTLSLKLGDGDAVYPLASSVDIVENPMRITSPVNYARPLAYVARKDLLAVLGEKTNNGTGTPTQWYYAEPSVSTSNVETKNVSFDIMPDQSYTVSYTFRSSPPPLVNPTDYPFFDPNYHHILAYYCLWQYAERNPDETMNPDAWERKWNEGLSMLLASYSSKVMVNAPIVGPIIGRRL